MKSLGQLLYEREHPKYIRVVRVEDVFRLNPFWVPNPTHSADWSCLTEQHKQLYEKRAKGHHLVPESQVTLTSSDKNVT